MLSAFLLAGLLALSVDASIGVFPNLCATEGKSGSASLPVEIKLPSSYQVSAVLTDWKSNSTSLIDETRQEKSYLIRSTNKDGSIKWTTIGEKLVLINQTGCSSVNSSSLFSLPSDISSSFPIDVSSLSKVIESIVDKKINGVNSYVRVVSGVEGVGWVGCINSTASPAVVAVEVVYAGQDSYSPPTPGMKNPLVLSVSLSSYTNVSDVNATMTARISLDFEPFRGVEDIQKSIEVDHGVVCDGLEQQSLTLSFPDEFEAVYTKEEEGKKVTGRLTYDSRRSLIGESVVDGKALLFNQTFENEVYLAVHDIAGGSEFVFSSTPSCSLRPLPPQVDSAPNLIPAAIQLILPNLDKMNVSLYSNVTRLNGQVLEYRASSDGKVIEITVEGGNLTTVTTYAAGKLSSRLSMGVIGKDFSRTHDTMGVISLLNGCFNHKNDQLVSFVLDGVSNEKLASWREDLVWNEMGVALSHIPNVTISPYRLAFFYIREDKAENTRVVMKVSDSSKEGEMTGEEFIKIINATMVNGFQFPIMDKETWKTTSSYILPYPPPPPPSIPSFVGYTGGSMFVIALFCIIFGVAVGAGGVYIVLRKQRISTLAYQVFE